MELLTALFALRDEAYQAFQAGLIPNIEAAAIIGVRTPNLRALSRRMEDGAAFMDDLPHRYFEENQIHSFLIGAEKDFDTAVREVERFLPYVDNWAVCDQLSPRAFKSRRDALLPYIRRWLASGHPYTIRFAMKMLMAHYLDDAFRAEYLDMVASVHQGDYYVRMMVAWYFATALAKQYEAVLPYITEYRLEPWIHNKTIQKACESYRILPEEKTFLRSCRINRSTFS